MIRPAQASFLVALLAAACASGPSAPPAFAPEPAPRGPNPTPFSTAAVIEALPAGWQPFRITRFKKLTEYRLVPFNGSVAMRAVADASASGLRFETVADVHEYPWLTWKWKVTDVIEAANNSLPHAEDSPARVIVIFEGGRELLSPDEQINYDLAKSVAGNELPYATLMYIWENHLSEGEIIAHHFTSRIKMIVAGSGRKDLNEWHEERVNLLEDYRRAFGEEPPRVKAVGIMTDTDNTGTHAIAFYGDIRFQRR